MATKAEKFKAHAEIHASAERSGRIETKRADEGKAASNGDGVQSDKSSKQSSKHPAQTRTWPHEKRTDVIADMAGATDNEGNEATNTNSNRSAHAARKATFALEVSDGARPSRKSTRGSANRSKPDSQLKRRQTRAVRSPKARATKAQAGKNGQAGKDV